MYTRGHTWRRPRTTFREAHEGERFPLYYFLFISISMVVWKIKALIAVAAPTVALSFRLLTTCAASPSASSIPTPTWIENTLQCAVCKTKGLDELGKVDDCCLDAELVGELNSVYFRDVLDEIAARDFFAFFRVDLERGCRFPGLRDDNGMCSIEECSVCTCSPDEVPLPWRQEEREECGAEGSAPTPGISVGVGGVSGDGSSDGFSVRSEGADGFSQVISRVSKQRDSAAPSARDKDRDDVWIELKERKEVENGIGGGSFLADVVGGKTVARADGDSARAPADDSSDALATGTDPGYVDLRENPEGFTGYEGDHAHAVWSAIYDENCFEGTVGGGGAADVCVEKRLFYRLISGLQSSITTHIASRYMFRRAVVARPPLSGVLGVDFKAAALEAKRETSRSRKNKRGSGRGGDDDGYGAEVGMLTLTSVIRPLRSWTLGLLSVVDAAAARALYFLSFLRHLLHASIFESLTSHGSGSGGGGGGGGGDTASALLLSPSSLFSRFVEAERIGGYWSVNAPLYAARVVGTFPLLFPLLFAPRRLSCFHGSDRTHSQHFTFTPVGQGAHQEYLENLFFAYLFVLRACRKAGPYLTSYDFSTGDAAEDARTSALVRRLLGREVRHVFVCCVLCLVSCMLCFVLFCFVLFCFVLGPCPSLPPSRPPSLPPSLDTLTSWPSSSFLMPTDRTTKIMTRRCQTPRPAVAAAISGRRSST